MKFCVVTHTDITINGLSFGSRSPGCFGRVDHDSQVHG